MNGFAQHESHPLRGAAAEWLPAPSLEQISRQRLQALLIPLALLHLVLAAAHIVDPDVWELRPPRTFFVSGAFQISAFVLALVSAVYLAVLRLLVPRMPLRWGQALAALTATLLTVNALGIFAIDNTPGKTVGVILAVIGASALLFCPRMLSLVMATAIGGWVGLARQAGFGPDWYVQGALLAGACAMSLTFQRLQVRTFIAMLRGVAVDEPPKSVPDPAQAEEQFRRWYQATFEGIAIHEKGVILEANHALADLLQRRVEDLPGKNLLDWFTRASRSVIEESILLGNFRPFEAVVRTAEKSELHLEVFTKRISYQGREVMATAFRDITERRRAAAETALEQRRLEQEYKRQSALAKLPVNATLDQTGPLLDQIATTIAEVLPASGGAALFVFENGALALAACHLPPRAREAGFDPAVQLAKVGDWIAEQKKPFISSNIGHDDPFSVGQPVEFVVAYAGIPLLFNDSILGVLFALENAQTRHFDPSGLDFLTALADRAAAGLAQSRIGNDLRDSNESLRRQLSAFHRQTASERK